MSPLSDWSDRALRRAGWATWLFHLSVLLVGLALALAIPDPTSTWGSAGFALEAAFVLMAFSFPCVGLVIVHRKPPNRMGWLLLLGVGMALSLPSLLDEYAAYTLVVDPGVLPGGAVAAGLVESSWIWLIGSIGIFVILLFPDGHLPSPGWRWLPPVALSAMVVLALGITVGSETLTEGPVDGVANPMFVESVERAQLFVLQLVLPLMPACMVAAAVALVQRFRRSSGVERQQLKWLAEAGVIVATCYLAAMVGQFLKPDAFSAEDPAWLLVLQNLSLASFGLLPVAIGIALLRHRLYDIDRILNRTVVYAVLTATLVGTYLVSVLLLRVLLDPVTGDSDLAVAASTLAVAALFRPVRGRIQQAVDRRFYRSKYDATRTVEAFAARLGQEVDLDEVSTDLRLVVRDTVQPEHVSLWLREPA
ncbi:hypothetical protein [Nocardioides sp. GXQ0305]|uniref:hypothetical protein n=1 Tax=Nocardioides sp. GXQ0305 TaxID=3423912 RepID=UPI003D7D1577